MQHTTTSQFGLKLLSAFWMISTLLLLDISSTNTPNKQANTFAETKSNVSATDTEYLLERNTPTNNQHNQTVSNNWLSLVPLVFPEVFLELSYEQWPDQSQRNSYRNIISYQYHISSLSPFINQ